MCIFAFSEKFFSQRSLREKFFRKCGFGRKFSTKSGNPFFFERRRNCLAVLSASKIRDLFPGFETFTRFFSSFFVFIQKKSKSAGAV